MGSLSIRIDPNTRDIAFDEIGRMQTIEGLAELAQAVRLRLLTNEGEWMFDRTFGVPWLELLGQRASQQEIVSAISLAILREPRIQSLLKVEPRGLDYENRSLGIYIEAQTTEGLLAEEVAIG